MSRSLTSVAIVCFGLAVTAGGAVAKPPQLTASAKPVALRTAAAPATTLRAARPATRAVLPAADAGFAGDGERFRYDSCGCSGG